MNVPFNKTPNIIFAALVPLLIAFTFLFFYGSDTSENDPAARAFIVIPGHTDTVSYQEVGDSLITRLLDEANGQNRGHVLLPLITEASLEIYGSTLPEFTPLVDVLSTLSISHPDNSVRLAAYRTMLMALDIQQIQQDDSHEFALN
ncbi:hypothetical protein QLX67_04765 [Balneolaceae bacterium ANBcel3]|nr:hypothetical protein [Balneolaceae bacterium ANBcel3]